MPPRLGNVNPAGGSWTFAPERFGHSSLAYSRAQVPQHFLQIASHFSCLFRATGVMNVITAQEAV